jgi:hypothetical protein
MSDEGEPFLPEHVFKKLPPGLLSLALRLYP